MEITVPIDIEEEIRKALAEQGVTIYCKPLPKDFALPCILVTCVGMTSRYNWANQATRDGFACRMARSSFSSAPFLGGSRITASQRCPARIRAGISSAARVVSF